jgi:hypothetical protein
MDITYEYKYVHKLKNTDINVSFGTSSTKTYYFISYA